MYAIRGLIECSVILDDSHIQLADAYLSYTIDKILELRKYPGSFSSEGKPNYGFNCVTGHLQLIVCLIKRAESFDPEKLRKTISILFTPIFNAQRSWGPNKGAVPSSIPFYGPYQRFKFTNWTQKFYCDAALSMINHFH